MSNLIALHGFLGEASDWDFLEKALPYPLFDDPVLPFWDWAQQFNQKMLKLAPPRTLLGYSLGGRLALHALIDNPSQWDRAVIVSANPGIVHDQKDENWPERFIREPWEQLMEAWNRQPLFLSGKTVKREEKHFSRKQLSRILSEWSMTKQENLLPQIAALPLPILWVSGENDQKYRRIANEVALSHPRSKKAVVPNAAHRVPWDNPLHFSSLLNKFW